MTIDNLSFPGSFSIILSEKTLSTCLPLSVPGIEVDSINMLTPVTRCILTTNAKLCKKGPDVLKLCNGVFFCQESLWRIFLNIHIVECNSDNPIINVSQG